MAAPSLCFVGTTTVGLGLPCPFSARHRLDLLLCEELERLADGLPQLPNNRTLRRLTERLAAGAERWAAASSNPYLIGLDGVRSALIMDSVHAEDVSEAVWNYWRVPDQEKACSLGYMLRALFDGRKRSIKLERHLLGCTCCQSSDID